MKAAARAMWQQATQMVCDAAGDEQIYAEWVENLASRDVRVQVPAIWALQQAGTSAIPVLVTGLSNAQTRIRRNCVDVIDHGGYGGDGRCVIALLPLLTTGCRTSAVPSGIHSSVNDAWHRRIVRLWRLHSMNTPC